MDVRTRILIQPNGKPRLIYSVEWRLFPRFVQEGECLIWQGAKSRDGYGYIWVGTRTEGTAKCTLVHRLIYELEHGPLLPGFDVDHTCRKRACGNLWHLFKRESNDNRLDGLLQSLHLRHFRDGTAGMFTKRRRDATT